MLLSFQPVWFGLGMGFWFLLSFNMRLLLLRQQ